MGCDLAVKWHEFNRKVVNDDQAVETSTPAWYASVITLTFVFQCVVAYYSFKWLREDTAKSRSNFELAALIGILVCFANQISQMVIFAEFVEQTDVKINAFMTRFTSDDKQLSKDDREMFDFAEG